MNTTFFLIRHASHDLLGHTMAGRMAGVNLSEQGRREAQELVGRLADVTINTIYSSPLERAKETAGPIAASRGLTVHSADELNEVDFGDWTGMNIDQLHSIPTWNTWNTVRSCSRPPGGEMLVEIQARIVSKIEVLRCKHGNEQVALFSHSDTIRAALTFYLGMPVDLLLRLEICPASVTILRFFDTKPQILLMNGLGEVKGLDLA
jgi:broad specificity phosphatase PhoE